MGLWDYIWDLLFASKAKPKSRGARTKPKKPKRKTPPLTELEIAAVPREDGIRDRQHYLSIKQPWAWLVLKGLKDIENRSWKSHHRGELFIHASSNKKHLSKDIESVEKEHGIQISRKDLKFGALLGSVIMVDCVEAHESAWFEGRYGHVYCEPRMIVPIKMKANAAMQRTGQIKVRYIDSSGTFGEQMENSEAEATP
jgi:hypothetical protein